MTTNQLRWAELKESQRHNVVTESENVRHNVASEAAAYTSAAGALLRGQAAVGQVGLGYANLGWSKEQYNDTGREQIQADTALKDAEAGYKEALTSKVVPVQSENIAQDTKTKKSQAFANWTKGVSNIADSINTTVDTFDTGLNTYNTIGANSFSNQMSLFGD